MGLIPADRKRKIAQAIAFTIGVLSVAFGLIYWVVGWIYE